jgi:hypothetical protein
MCELIHNEQHNQPPPIWQKIGTFQMGVIKKRLKRVTKVMGK